MELHEASRDREPEPEPARELPRRAPLNEGLEDRYEHVSWDADAVVAYLQSGELSHAPRRDRDIRPHRAVLRGVLEEIRHDLREAPDVGVHEQASLRHIDGQSLFALLERRAGHLHRAFDGDGELHGRPAHFELASSDARDVDHVVHEPREMDRLALDHPELA